MLMRDESVLIFVDVQGRLHEMMAEKAQLDENLERMILGAQLLGLPLLATEQIPEKLGPTAEPFLTKLAKSPRLAKTSFSCCGDRSFMEHFRATQKSQAILVGIETHICIYQTAMDLLDAGIEVVVVADAVSSRTLQNKELALQALRGAGAQILPTETVLFSLLRDASDPAFKAVLSLIK